MSQEELAELYRRYGHLVLRRCRYILRDESGAEDVLQEVFVRALKYHRSLERAESKLGWLYRTSERFCFDRIGKGNREVSIGPDVVSQVAQQGIPHSAIEARDVVLAFLGKFDKKVQQVAVLHYLDGLSQEEIAKQLGWSRRTVGKKLRHLKDRARSLARSLAATNGGSR